MAERIEIARGVIKNAHLGVANVNPAGIEIEPLIGKRAGYPVLLESSKPELNEALAAVGAAMGKWCTIYVEVDAD